MGDLYIGTSGLQTSQNALNTTAHNLSNVDTTGYTRQQVQQSDKSYNTLSVSVSGVSNQQVGLGVTYSDTKQVRDFFLDQAYRRESGRSMFYEVSANVLEQVESLLGEFNGESFQTTLTDFWTAVQELAKDPCSSVTQGLLVQRASELVESAADLYDALCDYQDNLNSQVKSMVDKINKYGRQLVSLNDQICAIESGGIEHANDLRDERNRILDELSELVNMSWSEDQYGRVSVRIEGVDFVSGGTCYEIGLQTDKTTGFYTPFWPQNADYTILSNGQKEYAIEGAEVFNLDAVISTDMDTDIGGLKAVLLARGDHRADYTDITSETYEEISQSILMNIQAEFDQMIHNIVTAVNSILASASGLQTGDLTLSDGTVLKDVQYCKSEPEGYLRNEDGSPIQIFTKITTDAYRKVQAIDPDTGDMEEYWIYNEEDPERADSLYSLGNLQIDQNVMKEPAMLGFRLEDGSEDMETMEALKKAFTEEAYCLNPNVKKKTTLIGYYDDLVSQVANSGSVYRRIYIDQTGTVEGLWNARQQVVGVSSDEELTNMIKFQNAYNACSRYINVVNEMLEHIINTLGA